ncbi:MAG: laminin B domain-containing protein [Planctomycetota bacterium]|nr:laminin B domain-containing protein [Planctomycetota bacterium]
MGTRSMTTVKLCRALVVMSMAVAGAAHAQTMIVERFESGSANGWGFYNDGKNVRWDAGAGNPKGCVRADDAGQGGYWGFTAGPAFLGDRSCMYGGILAWDFFTSHTSTSGSSEPDVVLVGGGLTLVQDLPEPAANAWISRIVTIAEGAGWRKNSISGAAATRAEIEAVLANLTAIRVRAEFSVSIDNARIDNVVLASFLVTPPQGLGTCPGDTVSFAVTASRGVGPYAYQWRKDGLAIDTTQNPSAATATLTLPNVQEISTGSYDCIVTSSASSCNVIISEAADLKVCPSDFTCDGFLEFGDFDAFVDAFESGEPRADFDADGFITFEDFDAFVLRFEAGC